MAKALCAGGGNAGGGQLHPHPRARAQVGGQGTEGKHLPSPLLFHIRASGHMERFSDYMVKDEVTGECFRADHLLEEVMEKLMADPKCPTENRREFQLIERQVHSHTHNTYTHTHTHTIIHHPISGEDTDHTAHTHTLHTHTLHTHTPHTHNHTPPNFWGGY